MQVLHDLRFGQGLILSLPKPEEILLPGVRWGMAGVFFTPAFWKSRLWYARNEDSNAFLDYKSGATLHQEVTACLLGGHGITSEMAQAAFRVLRLQGLLEPGATREVSAFEAALRQPLLGEHGNKPIHYRYPRIKAEYVARTLDRLDRETPPVDDLQFRNWLLSFRGIGWKTASWVTRNWRHSNSVAIIDIHVFRAGVIAGFFDGSEATISKRYPSLEARFLEFCSALSEEARRLDVLIWRLTKDSGPMAIEVFKSYQEPSAA